MSSGRFDYVRAFSQAAENVIIRLLAVQPERGTLAFQVGSSVKMDQFNLIIGLTGVIKGQVCYSMSREVAKAIASLMMGREILELDVMAESALCEFANMISGNATIILAEEEGGATTITPPTIVIGNSLEAVWYGVRTMIIPFHLSVGSFSVLVGLTADHASTPTPFQRGTRELS